MIGHPLLVGALFHSHQIANLELHFKRACARRSSVNTPIPSDA
jgi:hypothetical protein